MRTIWTFIDEAGGAAANVTSQNPVCGQWSTNIRDEETVSKITIER
jgi:hypothetical protein